MRSERAARPFARGWGRLCFGGGASPLGFAAVRYLGRGVTAPYLTLELYEELYSTDLAR